METEHLTNTMIEQFITHVSNGLDLVAVVADSTSTAKITPFMEKYPDRVINVGIAEQSMVSTAVGLSFGGKTAVTCNAAPFLISRSNEQIKIDVCYNDANVKMFGLNSGASYGTLASTHHCTDDIGIMRGFGRVEIYSPADAIECKQIIDYAFSNIKPIYIRLDGKPLPIIHNSDYKFIPGDVDVLFSPQSIKPKIAIVGLGSSCYEICNALALFENEPPVIGVNLSSIRPLNRGKLADTLKDCDHVITVEEHNISGGIGSILAEIIAEYRLDCGLKRLGIPDGGYAIAGDRLSTRKDLGIDSESIAQLIKHLL